MTTVALVAAKDAENSIEATVTALAALVGVDEVWVVDDGSTDGTADRAQSAGAHVVRLDRNRGKGAALTAGVVATPHATTYLLADADLGATASGLAPLLRRVASDRPELIVGVLPSAGKRGGFGLVKTLASAGIRRASGFASSAPLSGQRLVDADRLRKLTLAPRFGVEVAMTIDLVRGGATVEEQFVEVDHHHTGRSWSGFLHRARQGRDVAGALLSRVTSTGQRVACVLLAAVFVFGTLTGLSRATTAPRGAALPRAQRVLLFAFDRLSLDDLDRTDLPALRALQRSGASGALNVRTPDTRGRGTRSGPAQPPALAAYASLGASARVRATGDLGYARRVGSGSRLAAMPEAKRLSRRDHAANAPGSLGDALHAAHKRTGVVAVPAMSGKELDVPALAALADGHGRVDHTTLDVGLTAVVDNSALGRSSPDAFVAATAAAWSQADVVLVDPGETARAALVGPRLRATALRDTDAVLGALVRARPAHTAVIIFAPSPPGTDGRLTPVVLAGQRKSPGSVASSSTRRPALGVLSDLAPTALDVLGVTPAPRMTGTALRVTARRVSNASLRRLEIDGAVRGRFFLPAAVGYTIAGIIFYLGFIALMLRGGNERVRRRLRVGACIAAAFPLALLVQGAGQHWWGRGGESPITLMVAMALLGVVAARVRGLRAVYWLAAITVGIVALDVAATGPIHAASVLGYSLQTTGRFYGLPNASFSVYAASLLLVAAAAAGPEPTLTRATAGASVLGVGVAFLAAPWLGNDVGGTLTMVPVGLACAWVFFKRRMTLRVAVLGAGFAAVSVIALAAAEALFGSGTHLGRATSSGLRDNSSFRTTLLHRFDVNFGLLVQQSWGFLCIALALGSLFVLVARRGCADYLPEGSPLRAVTIGILVVSLLGFVVNDSGPVVIVLSLVVLAPAVALIALRGPVTARTAEPTRR